MKITLIQTGLAWENPKGNRDNFTKKIETLNKETDLIILPEMFATGFTMQPGAVAETMDGKTVAWMMQVASEKNCAITGSLIIKEAGRYYNRLLFVHPDGKIEKYDKRHLFSLSNEDEKFTAGKEKRIVEYKGWKICLLVCYDLRFPVFARNTEGYDLLLFVANWPEPRITAWDALLKARAIENMCYIAGVNRTGEDNNENTYPGHSQVIDCLGEFVLAPSDREETFTVTLDKQKLMENREKFGFLNDRDVFTLQD